MRCARACRLRPVCPDRARPALLLHEISDGDAEARRELSYGLRLARAAARDCADVCARDTTASRELRFAHATFGKKLLNLLRIYNHKTTSLYPLLWFLHLYYNHDNGFVKNFFKKYCHFCGYVLSSAKRGHFMNIGEAIRAKRKERGMTQIEVAQAAGIAVNSLRLYESGKRQPKQSVFIDIAHALGTNAVELMGYSSNLAKQIPEADICDMLGLLSDEIDIGLVEIEIRDKCNISTESAEKATEIFLSRFSDCFRTNEEYKIKPFLDELNERGKQVAIERIEELAEIPRYQIHPIQDD